MPDKPDVIDRDRIKRVLGIEEDITNEQILDYIATIVFKNNRLEDKIKAKIEEDKETLKKCNKAQDIDRIKALNERILFGKELLEE